MGTDDARLDELAASVAQLTQRVERLEREVGCGSVAPSGLVGTSTSAERSTRSSPFDLTLIGRSVLVIGGAYLLRAATELDAVPDLVGVGLGIVYAFALLALADRAEARRRRLDAALHGVTALLVAYPLTAELVLRFHLLGAWSGAAAIALFAGAAIAVAARRRETTLAWIAVGGTLVAAVVTGFAVQSLVPTIWLVVALMAAVEWLARRLDERLLIWPPAVTGLLLLAAVVFAVLMHRPPAYAAGIPTLALAMFLVVAGGAMARSGADRVGTTGPEMAQVGLALLVGFAGGAAAAVASGWGVAYGAGGLVLAAAGWMVALRLPRVAFWTSLWLTVGAIALPLVVGGAVPALAWVVLGVGLVVAGRRAHVAAELQGVLLLGAAAVASGLFAAAWRGLVGEPPDALPGAAAFVALAALLVVTRVLGDDGSRLAWVTRLLALVLAFVHAAGLVAATAIVATATSRPAASALRTVVLSLGAGLVAALGRWRRARQAALLVFPVLALAVAKVLVEDLRVGTAATQTLGLVCLGVALMIAPKLRPRARSST